MPTLITGNGGLELGASEKPKTGSFRAKMNRAATLLGILGTTIATDATAQQTAPIQSPGTDNKPKEVLVAQTGIANAGTRVASGATEQTTLNTPKQTSVERLLMLLDKNKKIYTSSLNGGAELNGEALDQYVRFQKDFKTRMDAKMKTLSSTQARTLQAIKTNYQRFYDSIVTIANSSPVARTELLPLGKDLASILRNPSFDLINPPENLSLNIDKKSRDDYSTALRLYNEAMRHTFAEYAGNEKFPKVEESLDGIFRVVAKECSDAVLTSISNPAVKAIILDFKTELSTFNVSIPPLTDEDTAKKLVVTDRNNADPNNNAVAGNNNIDTNTTNTNKAPSGTNLVGKDAWPFRSLKGFTYKSEVGAPTTVNNKTGELSVQASAKKRSSNFVRTKLEKVKGNQTYTVTVNVIKLDPKGDAAFRYSVGDGENNMSQAVFIALKETGIHTFDITIPETIEVPGKKPGKPSFCFADLVEMQGDIEGVAAPVVIFGGLHIAKKL